MSYTATPPLQPIAPAYHLRILDDELVIHALVRCHDNRHVAILQHLASDGNAGNIHAFVLEHIAAHVKLGNERIVVRNLGSILQ